MKKRILIVLCGLYVISLNLVACSKKTMASPPPVVVVVDTGLVNTAHLDKLYIPVLFPGNVNAAGIFIYSQYPDYHPVDASGEGFTCVDDVARAALVYLRSSKILSDTATQNKLYNLLQFIVQMQSGNGYFFNFLMSGNAINTTGPTSVNNANWWSWRALQALTEAGPIIKNINAPLFAKMNTAVNLLVNRIKVDLAGQPATTKVVMGITVPEWLPAGSGTDQSAVLMLGLINYSQSNNDSVITSYITKLADGIALMQQGDATHFPYDAFLSWENTWHAYGNLQSYALMIAGDFLKIISTKYWLWKKWIIFILGSCKTDINLLLPSVTVQETIRFFPRAVTIRSLMVLNRWYLLQRKHTGKRDRLNMQIWRGIWRPGFSVPTTAV